MQLTSRLVRAAGPDVSISWELVWEDPHNDDMAFRADIGDLRRGPPNTRFTEWYVAVTLTNAGSAAVALLATCC